MVEASADSQADGRSYRPGTCAVATQAVPASPDVKSPPLAERQLHAQIDRLVSCT